MIIIYALIAIVKVFLVISTIGLIAGIIWLWIKSLPFRPKLTPSETLNYLKVIKVSEGKYKQVVKQKEIAAKKWQKLMEKIKFGDERDYKLAIIEADIIIDEILKSHGHPGKDMGERLKSLNQYELEHLNDLWEVHKIRNRLAHEADFHIPIDEMKKIIGVYRDILEELLARPLEIETELKNFLEAEKEKEKEKESKEKFNG
ncbi:hypothetical protein HZB04_03755 [Candidatus Wolfebacteria bacterium]|nr:hypothetical protein [Candidatus Wolfebacteria bacterium]